MTNREGNAVLQKLARNTLGVMAFVVASQSPAQAQKPCIDPPKFLTGYCNKKAGGYCNTVTGEWTLNSERQIPVKNDCVSRNQGKPLSQWR
jgi:hypothetical protein